MSVTPIDLNGETTYVFDGNGTFLTQLTALTTAKIGSKAIGPGMSEYKYAADGWIQTSFGGAVGVRDTGVQGGRNPDSTTNNYNAVHEEVNKTLFNPDATTETVITAAPAYFYGFMSRTGTGTLTIRDDSAANGATSDFKTFTLGADDVNFPFGLLMESGITAQLGTATDDCTIFWRSK